MQFQIYFSASFVRINSSADAIVCLTGISFTALFYAERVVMRHWKCCEVWNRREILQFYLCVGDNSCSVTGLPWWVARHPSSCSLTAPPQQDGGKDEKKKLMGQDKDLPVAVEEA